MNNKFFVSLLTFIIAISLIAIGCTETESTTAERENEISNLEEELENKKETVQRKEDKIQGLEAEISEMENPKTYKMKMEQHQTFFEAALERLDEREVREVAEKGYQYRMGIPSDGKVEKNNRNFSLTIEEAAPFTLEGLDEKFKEKVRASRLDQETDQEESLPHSEWLDVKTEGVDYELKIASGGGELYILEFEEAPKGETVEVEIVPELKERVGLETKMLEIQVLED